MPSSRAVVWSSWSPKHTEAMPTSPDIGQKWIHRHSLSRGRKTIVTVIDVSSYRSGKEGSVRFRFAPSCFEEAELPMSKFLNFYQPHTEMGPVEPRTQWERLQAED
jgi:hypothetical protein